MTAFNLLDRPRVAVAGCTEDHEVVRAVQRFAGFCSTVALSMQPLQDRDAVVVWQDASDGTNNLLSLGGDREDHLRVLQFGGHPSSVWSPAGPIPWVGPRLRKVLGDELSIPPACPPELRALVRQTLLPLLASRGGFHLAIDPTWGSDEADFIPLVLNSNDEALAAIYRTPRIQEVWWLPVNDEDSSTFDFASWVEATFDVWHSQDLDRFPGPPDWSRSTEWMTAEELELNDSVSQAQKDLDDQVAKLQAIVDERTQALAEAQARHDAEERLLLTAKDEVLLAAVKSMLERIGFDVEDRDETRDGQKLEDLRVRDPDPDSFWIALAEVKGHLNAGGRPGEIAKINRFAGIYEGQHGSLPNASWYVVNQFASRPPARRRRLMDNHPEDVEQFARELNGVVIDTRDLFILDRRVATGEITQERARALLMAAEARFELDSPGNETNDSALDSPAP